MLVMEMVMMMAVASFYQCVLFMEEDCGMEQRLRKRKGNCNDATATGELIQGMIGIGGLKKKESIWLFLMKLKEALENQGFTVVMTRQEDKGLLKKEQEIMKKCICRMVLKLFLEKAKPILAVSIHQNSYTEERCERTSGLFL